MATKIIRPQVLHHASQVIRPVIAVRKHCCTFRRHLQQNLCRGYQSNLKGHFVLNSVSLRPLTQHSSVLSSTTTFVNPMHTQAKTSDDVLSIIRTSSQHDVSSICGAITNLKEALEAQDDNQKTTEMVRLVAKSDEFSDLCQFATNQVSNMANDDLCSVMQAISSTRDLSLWPDSIVDALYVEGERRVMTFDIQQLDKFANLYRTFDMGYKGRYKGGLIARRFSELLYQFSVDNFRELVTIMDSTLFLTTSHFKVVITDKITAILNDMIGKGRTDEVTGEAIAKIIRWAVLDVKQFQGVSLKNNSVLLDICCQLLYEKLQSTSTNDLRIALLNLRNIQHGVALQKSICNEVVDRLPKTTDVQDIGCSLYMACFDRECIARMQSDMMGLVEVKIKEVLQKPEKAPLGHLCFAARLLQYEFTPELMSLLCTCIKDMSFEDGIHRNPTQVAKYLTSIIGLSRSSGQAWDCLLLKFEEIQTQLYNPTIIVDFLICQLAFPRAILFELDLDLSSYEGLLRQLDVVQLGELARQLLALRRKRRCIPRNMKISEIMSLFDEANYQALENIEDIKSVFHLAGLFNFVLNEQDQFPDHIIDQIIKQVGDILSKCNNSNYALMWARTLDKKDYLDVPLLNTLVAICADNIKQLNLEDIAQIVQAACFSGAQLSPEEMAFLQDCADQICQDLSDVLSEDNVPLIAATVRNMSYVEAFPEPLLMKIFSAEFLEKVDEIQADQGISSGLKNQLQKDMVHLNRTVVLECPELQIPWFSEEICQEQMKRYTSGDGHPSTQQVEQALAEVLGGSEYFRAGVIAPYGISISFELVLDSNNCPLPITEYGSMLYSPLQMQSDIAEETGVAGDQLWNGCRARQLPAGAHRLAVDYLNRYKYPINARNLLGPVVIKKRQLEILGYTYIQVPYFEWEELPNNHARISYLQDLIFHHQRSSP